MSTNGQTEARELHSRFHHPIIDADGHWAEYAPLMREEFRRIGGDTAVEALAMRGKVLGGSSSVNVMAYVRGHRGDDDRWAQNGCCGVEDLDDYSRCKITRKEDIRDLYVSPFYFGCEADDPINAWAFNRRANPMGARLNALFSSDIGHFDVPDMTDVVPEAYELVEHGLLTDDDFRDFMFTNAVRFWSEVNPDFFKGTVVEKQAADVLAKGVVRA